MRILLDTHILLWQMADDPRLSADIRTILGNPDHTKIVSDVSLWEVAVKIRTGKLKVDIAEIEQEIRYNEYERLAILRRHIVRLVDVPVIHRDPFDHLLIAQAQAEGLAVLTLDRKFRDYPVVLAFA